MAIVKQEMLYLPGNDRKMTTHSNLNLSASKRRLGVDRADLY